jgi:hypothetical protein
MFHLKITRKIEPSAHRNSRDVKIVKSFKKYLFPEKTSFYPDKASRIVRPDINCPS